MAKREPSMLYILERIPRRGMPETVKCFANPKIAARALQRACGAYEFDGECGRMFRGRTEDGTVWVLHGYDTSRD